jgi:hypothetical protein
LPARNRTQRHQYREEHAALCVRWGAGKMSLPWIRLHLQPVGSMIMGSVLPSACRIRLTSFWGAHGGRYASARATGCAAHFSPACRTGKDNNHRSRNATSAAHLRTAGFISSLAVKKLQKLGCREPS